MERPISSSEVSQSKPMPRWAVSMASATSRPSDQRCWRKAMLVSQSILLLNQGSTVAHASATTWAAEYAIRLKGSRGLLSA